MDNGHRDLAEAFIRRSEHCRFGDRRTGITFGLDLGRGDILAAADDDLLLAVDDEQIAILVEVADVARADPTVRADRRLGRFGIAEIALDVSRSSDADFAGLARREQPVASPKDRDLDQGLLSAPGGCGLGRVAAPEIGAPRRVGFGEAIAECWLGLGELRL